MSREVVECLLFVSGEPVAVAELARAAGINEDEVIPALQELDASLSSRGSGLQLIEIAGGWQLATRPEHADAIGRLLARGMNKLSRAALETLAIVAYRQPVTSPEVEAIRGVSSDGVLKTLLERRLIGEAGRRITPGRPMQYKTTPDFLHYFGIADIRQLPELDLDKPAPAAVPASVIADGIVEVPVTSTLSDSKEPVELSER